MTKHNISYIYIFHKLKKLKKKLFKYVKYANIMQIVLCLTLF